MFGEQFYPTPEGLIDDMLRGIDYSNIKTVLEPSAGKGDIVEKVIEKCKYYTGRLNVDCIEIDSNLVAILKSKGMRVVHDDFLTFNTLKKYDLIAMNPPFKDGAKHLLKALDMQKDGGQIVCLLNSETLKNPYSNERKELLAKLDQVNVHCSIEYIDDGFIDAERETNVQIALLQIDVDEVERKSFIHDKLEKARVVKEEAQSETYQVAENDLFAQIVKQYEIETEMGVKLITEFNAMKPYMLSNFHRADIHTLKLSLRRPDTRNEDASVNDYLWVVRRKYWEALFDNKSFSSKFTNQMRSDLYNRLDDFAEYDFTYYNIKQLQLDLNSVLLESLEQSVLEVFEKLSFQYSMEYAKNVHYYNGWKTNKSWYINKKVIVPINTYSKIYGGFDRYKALGVLEEITKALNFLNGNKVLSYDITETLTEAQEKGERKISLDFFDVEFFKKGTAHITFKDLDLVKRLNLFAGQRKNWLPPSYGQKTYEEMADDEQAVVDDFEGKESYTKTFNNRGKWLINSNSMLMIEGT